MRLDGLALGLGDGSLLASFLGPWEVCDGDDKEGVAAEENTLVYVRRLRKRQACGV